MKTTSAVWIERAALTRQIEELVSRLHPSVTLERRGDDRVALPLLLKLTPLDDASRPIVTESITVVGKNISRRGLSFYHVEPLPFRRATIHAQAEDFNDFVAEIDLSWCRFSKPGWYESGGRLIVFGPAKRASG